MLLSCGIGPNYVEISTKSVKDVFDVGHFDFYVNVVYDISRHVGTGTGSGTDISPHISPHISPQIEMFAKEAICRIYQENLTISYWAYCKDRPNFTVD